MAKKKIDKLTKDQLAALELYIQLTANKFGKTKKSKYEEIARRMKLPVNTITAWIYRHEVHYREYVSEIVEEKNAIKCTFDGLTEKQTTYVKARLEGYGTDEAKKMAGYSEKTKTYDVERSRNLTQTIEELRMELITDTKLGAYAQINDLRDIKRRAKEGVTETEYVEENTPKGRSTKKVVKNKKSLDTEISAIREINNILGYSYAAEKKHSGTTASGKEIVRIDEEE
jgi:hypothetical protein